jgi:transposase InsO family protein
MFSAATDIPVIDLRDDPGKSWQNGGNESFSGKLPYECLSPEWFCARRG